MCIIGASDIQTNDPARKTVVGVLFPLYFIMMSFPGKIKEPISNTYPLALKAVVIMKVASSQVTTPTFALKSECLITIWLCFCQVKWLAQKSTSMKILKATSKVCRRSCIATGLPWRNKRKRLGCTFALASVSAAYCSVSPRKHCPTPYASAQWIGFYKEIVSANRFPIHNIALNVWLRIRQYRWTCLVFKKKNQQQN